MRKPLTAAVLVTALATGVFFALDGPMPLMADAIAGTREMPVIRLDDGSEVQLNASSAIAVDFIDKGRTVRLLRGEAFFKVAHAPERPFMVVAGTANVVALGTAFGVGYGNDDTGVTVTENAVQIVLTGSQAGPDRVKQGEQAIYDHAKRSTVVARVDGLVALAWRRRKIAVDNAPLSYVVEEMNRPFQGRINGVASGIGRERSAHIRCSRYQVTGD